jgi:cysteine desulfurase / selenocysteine lyase
MIKKEFPYFINNPNAIYLDNSSTTLRHKSVIEGYNEYINNYSMNIGRTFGPKANEFNSKIEIIRKKIKMCYNIDNFFFSFSATDGLNQVIRSLHKNGLVSCRVLMGIDNHNASILPVYETKLPYDYIYLNQDKELDFDNIDDKEYDLIVLTMTSNVLGNQLKNDKIKLLRNRFPKAYIIIDGTQYLSYKKINFKELEIDAFIGSFHKMYGPSGVGIVMYSDRLLDLIPDRVGGGVIDYVNENQVKYLKNGEQFEAGTINTDSLLSLDYLIDFLEKNIYNIEFKLNFTKFFESKKIDIISSKNSSKILSFTHKTMNNYDFALLLSLHNISVRIGNMCCDPLMKYLKLNDGVIRISIGVYNTQQELDAVLKIIDFI